MIGSGWVLRKQFEGRAGMVPLQSGEESEALRKNGDRPHFLLLCPQVENVLFLAKWGLSPFSAVMSSS